MDFGTQATLDGKVAVVCPNPSLKCSQYFDWQSRATYPLFGKMGNGFGGMEIKGVEGINVIKTTAYPGRFVHHMKALGLPNKSAPRKCEARWFGMQWSKLQTLVAQMGQLADNDVAGLRVEMRMNYVEASWAEQERVLISMLQEICKHLDVKELSLEGIHQDSVEALGKAEGAQLLFSFGLGFQQDLKKIWTLCFHAIPTNEQLPVFPIQGLVESLSELRRTAPLPMQMLVVSSLGVQLE